MLAKKGNNCGRGSFRHAGSSDREASLDSGALQLSSHNTTPSSWTFTQTDCAYAWFQWEITSDNEARHVRFVTCVFIEIAGLPRKVLQLRNVLHFA
eukprot:764119-Hanusia_phi.AAC.3